MLEWGGIWFVLSFLWLGCCLIVLLGVGLQAVVNKERVDISWENLFCNTLEALGFLYILFAQFLFWDTSPPKIPTQSRRRKDFPILMVPGYALNRWSLAALRRYLHQQGYTTIWATNNANLRDNIHIFVKDLAKKIDHYYALHQQPIVLIGHSMGGLICRQYIEQYGQAKIRATISLATPYRGTVTYRLGIGKVATQFKPNSEICNITEAPNLPHLIIRSRRDWTVLPFEMTHLNGANERIVSKAGHLGVLFSTLVFQHIRRFLQSLDAQMDAEGSPEVHSVVTHDSNGGAHE